MKTEAEVIARLEKAVSFLEQFTKDYGDTPDEQVPKDKKDSAIEAVLAVFHMGWVLDCEEELKPLVRAFKIASIAEKLEGKL